jgi:hypothetical protein
MAPPVPGLRLEPADEYPHAVGPEPHFNESVYANFFPLAGTDSAACGFVRLGNRPNEGTGEVTVCLWLPDGQVAFSFARPPVTDNVFSSAGLEFSVVEPFAQVAVRFTGEVWLLEDPSALQDPRAALASAPRVPARIELDLTGVAGMFGGEPDEARERPGEEFARGHTEQLMSATGTIEVAGSSWPLTGAGLRDHSWGPRTWQAPWWYRWLTGNLDEGGGFMVSRVARRDSDGLRGGFMVANGVLHLCNHAEVDLTTDPDTGDPIGVEAVLAVHRDGVATHQWHISGEPRRTVPLRNRREGSVTRITESPTHWRVDDGRTGRGILECLDQIIDGRPAGEGAS